MRWDIHGRALSALAFMIIAAPLSASSPTAAGGTALHSSALRSVTPDPTADLDGVVGDSASGVPLAGAEVLLMQGNAIVARTTTDRLGHFHIHNLAIQSYQLEVRLIGFHAIRQTLDLTRDMTLTFRLTPASLELSAIDVASTPVVVDTRTGNQVFKQDEFQGSPTLTTSQIVQQAIVGAARAPTGEVHIRGQHAEYSYYVDGIPVPAGISGSLNELFDPSIVNQINFQTGAWDAEYGGKNAAIINVTTRIPSGGFHGSASGYGGDYANNGQTITASGNSGKWGLFFAGTRTATDMRREPVQAAVDTNSAGQITNVRSIQNFNNHGEDYYTFGKVAFSPTNHDVINLDANWSRTAIQTPFDSTAGVIDDHERDVNAFVNLGWLHRVTGGAHPGSELFMGGFYRHGSLSYVPGVNDTPSFTFAPDTTPYNISEARSFDIYGVKLDYLLRLREELSFKFGALASIVRGNENFQSTDSAGNPGPSSLSNLNGSDVGFYAQTQIAPSEQWELRAGLRYDVHRYPLSPTQDTSVSQWSPRLRLSYFPSPSTSLWVYYGRQFVPTNTEDLRNITSSGTGTNVSTPTVPERDDFYEFGLTHRFPVGLVLKLAAYQKNSSPGIDDTQVPGTAITTNINIEHIRVQGIEGVLEIRPRGPLTGFLNVALNHAYNSGTVTGGFFTVTPPAQPFDADHDQRLSIVGGLTYATRGLLLTATGIYGSGLTNGVTPNTPGRAGYDSTLAPTGPLGGGLLDFNKEFKVNPSFIMSASVGYTFVSRGVVFRPQLFVDNIFDLKYSLKGTFFSGATFGKPRTFQLRMSVGI
jgi:outer membrane receptor protein involved in Fe transport